jgi:hypothetical protein
MIGTPYFEILALLTETSICLSPAVIKTVDTTVETSVLIKLLVYVLMSFLLLAPKDLKSVSDRTFENLTHYLLLGLIYFTILSLTYFGFKELPLGTGMSINYSFPIILAIVSHFSLGYEQPLIVVPFFVIVYILMLYTLFPKKAHIEKFNSMQSEKQHQKYKAIAALALGSLLSCVSFILRKTGFDTHETSTIRTNIGALLLSLAYFTSTRKMPDTRPTVWLKLILFNITIGYIVSKFRSLAFNSVSEVYYGIFVFLGAILAYKISEYLPHLRDIESEDFKTY